MIDSSRFARNRSLGSGGAVALETLAEATIELSDTTLAVNEAEDDGGAIWLSADRPRLVARRVELLDNTAAEAAAAAIAGRDPTVELVQTTMRRNATRRSGGAAVEMDGAGTLLAADCDLGAGADDNVTHDILFGSEAIDGGPSTTLARP